MSYGDFAEDLKAQQSKGYLPETKLHFGERRFFELSFYQDPWTPGAARIWKPTAHIHDGDHLLRNGLDEDIVLETFRERIRRIGNIAGNNGWATVKPFCGSGDSISGGLARVIDSYSFGEFNFDTRDVQPQVNIRFTPEGAYDTKKGALCVRFGFNSIRELNLDDVRNVAEVVYDRSLRSAYTHR